MFLLFSAIGDCVSSRQFSFNFAFDILLCQGISTSNSCLKFRVLISGFVPFFRPGGGLSCDDCKFAVYCSPHCARMDFAYHEVECNYSKDMRNKQMVENTVRMIFRLIVWVRRREPYQYRSQSNEFVRSFDQLMTRKFT